MQKEIKDNSRLCIHTITTKPWTIEEAAEKYSEMGIGGITVWRDALEGRDIIETSRMLKSHNLNIISLCRGGFFPSVSAAKRRSAIDDNKKAVDEAAALGAPMIVLVCGADPDQSLEVSRNQIREGIETILPYAESHNIKLAIEPLHPMYADTRSAITTLSEANELAEYFKSPTVGVAIDVYHLWWDKRLHSEIERCGKNENIFAFHICDWKVPTEDFLLDRGLMGEGCIDIRTIRQWVEQAGFDGYNEVEIFSEKYWKMDQNQFLNKIIEAYHHCC